MQDTNANLATLIGSRICHDLISPIGAIANGLELLDLTGAADGPEFDLIADSAGHAGARIRFFRIAYGAAGEQMLGRSEVRSILDNLWNGARVSLDWTPNQAHMRGDVRLAFLAIQCCETALPYGGQISVGEDDGTWTITATGETLNMDEPLWAALAMGRAPDPVTPAVVQFALLPEILRDSDRNITVEQRDQSVTLRF